MKKKKASREEITVPGYERTEEPARITAYYNALSND
jgi:hypothetical protein